VRPFFPFNPRWYAGGIVFIFEPVLFAALLLALVMPWLLSLADREMGVRKQQFRGRGWAIFALLVMVGLWGWRAVEQHSAKRMMLNEEAAQDGGPAQVTRVAVSPYPLNPYHWQAVVETPEYFRVADINLLDRSLVSDAQTDIFHKMAETPATLAAKKSWLGHVYLDWAQFPVVEEAGTGTTERGETATLVRFRDLRFDYNNILIQSRGRTPPLGAAVYVNAAGQVVQTQVGEHIQHDGSERHFTLIPR
jgi:inner membrane protein